MLAIKCSCHLKLRYMYNVINIIQHIPINVFPVTMAENYSKVEGTMLIDAIQKEDLENINVLMSMGMSVNESDANGTTPLEAAIDCGNLEIVRLLLMGGADVNLTYSRDTEDDTDIPFTPLLHALDYEEDAIALALVKAGAKLDTKNHEGATPLHLAVNSNYDKLVDEMIQHKSSVNAKDDDGYTALMVAAMIGSKNILKKLLDNSARINDQDENGCTAIMLAVENYLKLADYDTGCIELLREHNADLNIVDEHGSNILMRHFYAWTDDKEHMMFSLIQAGCNINTRNGAGLTPLLAAVEFMRPTMVEALIAHGADINCLDVDNQTPLYYLAGNWVYSENECTQIAKLFLDGGANPNISHPLSKAAASGHVEFIQLLLAYGADINTVHPMYGTVLFNAGVVGKPAMAKIALDYKAHINTSHIPDDMFPEHPEHSNSHALMLMFAAGEQYPFFDSDDYHVPKQILKSRDDLSLKNLARRSLRSHIIKTGNHENLFEVGKKLEIPIVLKEYLVYGVSIRDEAEDSDITDDEDPRKCVFEHTIRWLDD